MPARRIVGSVALTLVFGSAGVAGPAGPELSSRVADALGSPDVRIEELALPGGAPPDRLRIPVEREGRTQVLDLRRTSVRSDRFRLLVEDARGLVEVPPPPPRTYRGSVEGDPGAWVAASLLPSGLRATVFPARGETWSVRPVADIVPGETTREHAVWTSRETEAPDLSHDMLPAGEPVPGAGDSRSEAPPAPDGRGAAGTCILKVADLAFDTDNEFFTRVGGSDTDQCLAFLEDGVNVINVPYIRDLKIIHRLSGAIIRPDPATDFYARFADASSFGAMLVAFRDEWNSNHPEIERDMAYYVTGKSNPEYGGLAYVSTTCSNYAYGMGLGYSGFTAILRHELGHNWGAGHECGLESGYIMCGNGVDAFSAFNIERITSFRDSRGCLDEMEYSTDPEPPWARPDFALTTSGEGPVVIEALAGDTDANCDALVVAAHDPSSAFGAEVRVVDGRLPDSAPAFLYLPRAGFTGTDTFRYTVSDGTGFEAETLVSVTVARRGLVAYWPLDESAGSEVSDAAGNGHDGELEGEATLETESVPGRFGRAVQFRGLDGDRIAIDHDPVLDLRTGLTVSAWFTVDAFANDGASIVAKGSSTWRLKRDGTRDALKFTCTGTTGVEARGDIPVADGAWHHAAGVYDGTRILLYIDGVLDASVASSGEIDAGTSSVRIGDDLWNGKIDDVRVYNHGLSAEEVRALHGGGRPENAVPHDGATGVTPGSSLSWLPGPEATAHDVYLGTDAARVAAAGPSSAERLARIQGSSLPVELEPATTYYWRVDEVAGVDIRKGPVRSFTSSIAFTGFGEPPLGAATWTPGAGAREIGFRTTSTPTDGQDPFAGTVETGSTPTSPVFSHRSVRATTTFDAIDVSGFPSVAAMLSLQARDTGYEAEDLLDVHVAGDGGTVSLLDLAGGAVLSQFSRSGYTTAVASLPSAWSTARLVISTSSDSSQGSERYDFDDVAFACFRPWRRIASTLFEEPAPGASSYVPGPGALELGFRTVSTPTAGASPAAAVEAAAGTSGGRHLSHRSVDATTTFDEVDLSGATDVVVWVLLRVRDTGYEAEDLLELYARHGAERIELVRVTGDTGLGALASSRYRTFSARIPASWPGATVVFRSAGNSGAGAEQYDLRMVELVSVDPTSPCASAPAGPRFRRGDSNGDGGVDISDGIGILNYLFLGAAGPGCVDAADTNDSGALDLSDGILIFNHLFLGAEGPPEPRDCGEDPTDDELGCASYDCGA